MSREPEPQGPPDLSALKEEIQRLKIRVVLLQSLAVQTALWGPSLAPPATLLANKRRLVAHIDEQGLLLEQQILRSRTAHTDAERAATADEVHAAVEELKSFFDVLQLPGPGPSGSA